MNLFVEHVWVVFAIATLVIVRSDWKSVQPRIREHPELEPGYRKLFLGYLAVGLAPWIGMGIGILSGRVSWMFSYLFPRQGNPFVLAWWGVFAAIGGVLTVWIVFGGGAEMIERHPGIRSFPIGPASRIRKQWLVLVAVQIAMGLVVWLVLPDTMPAPGGPAPPPEWIETAVPAFLVFMILILGPALAAIGGWGALAERYGNSLPRPERKFRFCSASIGRSYYNGVLWIAAGTEGIRFAVLPILRLGHPPFVVPWSDVTASRGKRGIFPCIELVFDKVPVVPVRLSIGLAESIFHAGGRTLPAEGTHGTRA